MSRSRRTSEPSGFTLFELLIVLTVLGIVAGTVVPAVLSLSPTQALAGARFVAADLNYVRSRAIALSKPLTVSFDLAQQRYTVSDADGPIAHPWAASTRFGGLFVVVLDETTPFSGVRLTSANFGGQRWIRFGTMGEPIESGSLTVRHGREAVTVIVEPGTGLVRVSR